MDVLKFEITSPHVVVVKIVRQLVGETSVVEVAGVQQRGRVVVKVNSQSSVRSVGHVGVACGKARHSQRRGARGSKRVVLVVCCGWR